MEKYIVTQDKVIVNMRNVQTICVNRNNAKEIIVVFSNDSSEVESFMEISQYATAAEAYAELERIIEWLATDEPVYRMTVGVTNDTN